MTRSIKPARDAVRKMVNSMISMPQSHSTFTITFLLMTMNSQRERQRQHDREGQIVRIRVNAAEHAVQAFNIVALGDYGHARHHHRNRLNEDDAAQAIKRRDEQEDQRPGDDNLGEFERLGDRAAFPDRRKKAADEQQKPSW